MSKVSVIIAAYNVEEYIAETINSVVAQTLKDIEIIVVDDCSTDGTFDIITKCAELDDRIKVIRHEVNKSLMQVRQTGLRNSCGDYVIFLDGDDKLAPNACEKAYKAIKSEKVASHAMASSIVTFKSVRLSGSMVVAQSCSASISPRPL